jgi:hypothetical protein
MSGVTDLRWERRLVPLKFQISDFTIASVRLPLASRFAEIADVAASADRVLPGPPDRSVNDRGYVVWSQPISAPLPVLRMCDQKIIYVPRQYRRFFIELQGGFEAYMAHFSSKSRATLKRKIRKFAERSGGAIEWRCYRTPEEVGEFFGLAGPLALKTYQERLFGGGLQCDAESVAAALSEATQDRVRCYLLYLEGRPIAYQYCPSEDGALIYDRQGYDPEYAALSPGTVLQVLIIEALFKEGRFNLLDFTEGEGQHKELFATRSQLCADIFAFDRRPSLLLAVISHHVVARFSSALGRVADRFGIRGRVRRLIREGRLPRVPGSGEKPTPVGGGAGEGVEDASEQSATRSKPEAPL